MRRILNTMSLGLMLLVLVSCGGTSAGMGNTVYLEASGKSGSTFSIYTNLVDTSVTPNIYSTGTLDYTIKSTKYPGTTNIAASDVRINEAQISYTPLLANDNVTMSPPLPSWIKYPAGIVAAGGTLDLSMIVVDQLAMTYFDKSATPATTVGIQYRYTVNVVFKGIEVTTGKDVVCPAVVANFYVTKNATL